VTDVIRASSLNKRFGDKQVLNDINLSVSKGEIVGLIGPNGAGKTTLLKSILGLAPFDGELSVLGKDPQKNRKQLMERVSFIADTAILPAWLKVNQAITFVEQTHPRFNKALALRYLESTNIPLNAKVSELSKGMVTKAHLSIIMAIQSDLLVLDEPTLGLDIIKRKEFYQQLLEDYFDGEKTILISTHQVEEIDKLVTRAVFINEGEIVLNESMEAIEKQYFEITTDDPSAENINGVQPIHIQKGIRSSTHIYKIDDHAQLDALGSYRTPSMADLFVAIVSPHKNTAA